jgi:hypothetical protein
LSNFILSIHKVSDCGPKLSAMIQHREREQAAATASHSPFQVSCRMLQPQELNGESAIIPVQVT